VHFEQIIIARTKHNLKVLNYYIPHSKNPH